MTTISTTQPKVFFPAPPPTTNSLTLQQRNQLLRKTKKLEQMLGAAPHLLDNSEIPNGLVHVDFPQRRHRRRSSLSTTFSRRSSCDSFSSVSAASTHSSTSQLLSSLKRSSSSNSSQPSVRRKGFRLKKSNSSPSSYSHQSAPSYECWSNNRPPFLRINTSPQKDDITPWETYPGPCGLLSKQFTLAPCSPDSDDSDGHAEPTFNITCARKTKMDRLRKKLGHGVPIELVFPSASSNDIEDDFDDDEEDEDEDEDEDDDAASFGGEWLWVTPPVSSGLMMHAFGSGTAIAGVRDSSLVQHRLPSSESLSEQSADLLDVPWMISPNATGRPLSAISEGWDETMVEEEFPACTTKAERRKLGMRPHSGLFE